MKIVKLMGGLGNQMFQWAFGYALSKELNEEVLYDLSWFELIKQFEGDLIDGKVAKRVYELEYFNVEQHFASEEQTKNCINEHCVRNSKLPGFLLKLIKKPKYSILDNKIFEKQQNIYEPDLLKLPGNKYFEGYFQCEKYFKEYRSDILKAFSLKVQLNKENKKILEKIKSTNSVSLHIRRGDYVKLDECISLKYYSKAIEYIAQNVENPYFFLFSDDIEWVVENLKINYSYTIVNINSSKQGVFDIELMKNCKHNIVANSSFSWWGAWLNENPKKIVIAPQKWFSNGQKTDIICENWITL